MTDAGSTLVFLAAALVIAITPGPGIFYVAARTLAGGRSAGLASSFGTGIGGLMHIAAGALGVSALVMASAEAFTVLKLAGAAYLVWLGVRTVREARQPPAVVVADRPVGHPFREGIVVEALNPKTAAFFLAFLPQFVDPAAGSAGAQFALLGLISVALNTAADVAVVFLAASAQAGMARRPRLIQRLREAAGLGLCGLGIALAFSRRPA